MKECINTEKAPKVNGCYSKGVKAGKFLFTSGQLPVVPETGEKVYGAIEQQTRRVLENIKAIVEAAGGTMQDIVKCTVYIKNMDDFEKVNQAYSEFFPHDPPARCCVEVARIHFDFDIEIDAIAYIEN